MKNNEDIASAIPKKALDEFEEIAAEERLNAKQKQEALELLHEEYKKSRISPGEAIGIITAESFGEPSTQMSVATNEWLILRINNSVQLMPIGKFVDTLMNINGYREFNNSHILPLHGLEIYVPSLDRDEKVQWKRVIECSRHKHPGKLMNIITASGRSITCTDNHSFVTRIDNMVIPVKGTALKIGNRIPTINNLSAPVITKDIKIQDEVASPMVVDADGIIHVPGTVTKPMQNIIPLDGLTGWFVGAYLSEGCGSNYALSISNLDNDYINQAKSFITSVGLNYKEDFHHRGFADSRDIKVSSSLLARFITQHCGEGSDFKKVPQFAYSASNEFVSGLLRGYFDGDGNIHVGRKMIRCSSNSKELIDGIALLLSRFKIFSFKAKDKKGQHWLLIPYKHAPLFLQHIGSDIDYKHAALEELAEKAKHFWSNKSRDHTDMISGFGELFRNAARKVGYPTRYVNNFTNRQKIGRTALFRYMKLFEQLAKEKNADISAELEIMQRMFYSDVIWDEIIRIEYVDYDHPYVYDLSVPGLETFTTAEGIITHNTLNVFHFAGVAEVAVTQGLPRLIELFDARKEIKTPLMKIYLDKEIAKDPDRIRKVAAQIKETRVEEVVSDFSIDVARLQIEMILDKQKMKNLSVTNHQIMKALEQEAKHASIKDEGSSIILKTKAKENELMETYKLKEKIKGVFIRGVKEITQVLPVKDGSEFMILAAGSNLKDVFALPGVDAGRTTTNDIFEVQKVLGIEAARQTIINEAKSVIEDQGLEVDVRHILFIADSMTATGKIKGITRSGIAGEKESVLARASFETPIEHLVDASLVGEVDYLNSVIENVMLNQIVPLGTGLPDLVAVTNEKKEDKK